VSPECALQGDTVLLRRALARHVPLRGCGKRCECCHPEPRFLRRRICIPRFHLFVPPDTFLFLPLARPGGNREDSRCDPEEPAVWLGEMGVESRWAVRVGKHDAEPRPKERFLTPFCSPSQGRSAMRSRGADRMARRNGCQKPLGSSGWKTPRGTAGAQGKVPDTFLCSHQKKVDIGQVAPVTASLSLPGGPFQAFGAPLRQPVAVLCRSEKHVVVIS